VGHRFLVLVEALQPALEWQLTELDRMARAQP
jgi:hypothetical protein